MIPFFMYAVFEADCILNSIRRRDWSVSVMPQTSVYSDNEQKQAALRYILEAWEEALRKCWRMRPSFPLCRT
jgi:hypothetical protein